MTMQKRFSNEFMEGAHWSHWTGIKHESQVQGVRILRPLLGLSKKEIQQSLCLKEIEAFDDVTNRDLHFLRARLRETIFPWLDQAFGKRVQTTFIKIGEDAQEIIDYFNQQLDPLLETSIKGPWGTCWDLQMSLPNTLLEIKYLLRLMCTQQGFFLSRTIIENAAKALEANQARLLFPMGKQLLRIDRRRIFITPCLAKQNDAPAEEILPQLKSRHLPFR